MSDFLDGRQDAYRGCADFLKRLNGLPSDMQLVMVRGWLDRLIEKQPTLAQIERGEAA